MPEPAPHLRVVDTATGEAQESSYSGLRPDELIGLLEAGNRELNAYRLRCGRLEKELADHQATEPDVGKVRDSLESWRRITAATRTGRLSAARLRAHIEPGSKRWSKVKAWLKHKSPDELNLCYVGATLDAWLQGENPRRQRYDDIDTILRDEQQIERLIELAESEMYVQPIMVEIPPELADDVKWLLQRCDCGHIRMMHGPSDQEGQHRCRRCNCLDFDDLMTRVEDWKAKRLGSAA